MVKVWRKRRLQLRMLLESVEKYRPMELNLCMGFYEEAMSYEGFDTHLFYSCFRQCERELPYLQDAFQQRLWGR